MRKNRVQIHKKTNHGICVFNLQELVCILATLRPTLVNSELSFRYIKVSYQNLSTSLTSIAIFQQVLNEPNIVTYPHHQRKEREMVVQRYDWLGQKSARGLGFSVLTGIYPMKGGSKNTFIPSFLLYKIPFYSSHLVIGKTYLEHAGACNLRV